MSTQIAAFPDFLRAVNCEPQPYSGRGMFGQECWSVADMTVGEFAAAVLYYERDERLSPDVRHMVMRALTGARVDSLGRGSVLYFPTEKV